jgi:hypothetical protein
MARLVSTVPSSRHGVKIGRPRRRSSYSAPEQGGVKGKPPRGRSARAFLNCRCAEGAKDSASACSGVLRRTCFSTALRCSPEGNGETTASGGGLREALPSPRSPGTGLSDPPCAPPSRGRDRSALVVPSRARVPPPSRPRRCTRTIRPRLTHEPYEAPRRNFMKPPAMRAVLR